MNFEKLVAPGIASLTPYEPGKPIKDIEKEFGVQGAIKLASNENPLGASNAVIETIKKKAHEVSVYPESDGAELKKELSKIHNVKDNQITLGNGSNDVIELLTRLFLTTHSEAVYSEFAFAMYELTTHAAGATGKLAFANPEDHQMPLGHNLDSFVEQINNNTKLVFIANPNNPTGTFLSPQQIKGFLNKISGEVIVLVDEAYAEYVSNDSYKSMISEIIEYPNLVVTRTFSKIYGLAGLRIGYSISHASISELLNRVRQPFNINNIAHAAALSALKDDRYISESLKVNSEGMKQMEQGCRQLSLNFIPSAANFLSINFGYDTRPIYEKLLAEGVIVRPLHSYNLPNYLRVTIGTEDQNNLFLQTLAKILKND